MKDTASHWFEVLQKELCSTLEALETEALLGCDIFEAEKFSFQPWEREGGGGGIIGILRGGRVFEKAGVNFSRVHGQLSPELQGKILGTENDPSFWACGLSLVIHPRSPWVPIVHLNTRMICTTQTWFGGGLDLTPVYPFEEDTALFHQALAQTCNHFDAHYYKDFKKACDSYFYIKHRKESRGVGGIFYDSLNSGDLARDLEFSKAVGLTFKEIYPQLVRKHFNTPWGQEEARQQMIKRTKYVEFNLIYDRGTEFGLKTGGNPEAIFVSLPPCASWA